MAYVTTEERVDRLEATFGQFMTEMAVLNKRADARQRAAEERLEKFQEEMREFKEEMREFKEEMREFKDEMRKSKKEMDRKWGDLSNKLGTIVEDILIPNLPRLALHHFKFPDVVHVFGRYNRKSPKDNETWQEFDALIVGSDYVILGEAKSSPSVEYAEQFSRKVATFPEYFPEYATRKLVPVFGSWSIHAAVKKKLTALGIYAMEMGEDTMQLVNAQQLDPKYMGA